MTYDINNKNNKIHNKNVNMPPRKKSVQILKKNNNNIPKVPIKKLSEHLRPSFKKSNLEDLIKNQKLNKEMVVKSQNFEKEFSFFYYLLLGCLKKKKIEENKNLSSLIMFRKEILSENFIFHQHIINLLLGKKCGIDPQEIKYLM